VAIFLYGGEGHATALDRRRENNDGIIIRAGATTMKSQPRDRFSIINREIATRIKREIDTRGRAILKIMGSIGR
jgi:hypothetical protein